MQQQQPEYIGFWLRVAAAFIDTAAVSLIILPILLFVFSDALPIHDSNLIFAIYSIITYGLPIVAIILFWIYKSATPGKMLIDAIIVDADTLGPPTKLQLIIRYLGYYVSIIPFCLGLFWVAWDERKQGFHDKLANTVVIHKSTAPTPHIAK
jgi:uncharacterized RDD family membrane protein YckC